MKSVWKIWWLALAVKIALALWLPLASDEAYYWVWSHHPALSYFDHPAMVSWLFWLGHFFENLGNGVRLPGVILGHLTLLVWTLILAPFLSEKKQVYWLLFLGLSPFLGLGSLILTPDIPFLFFWSLSLWLLLRAIETKSTLTYAALGAALGLGFCSKYLIVLFVPAAILWLAVSGEWRNIQWAKVPLTILIGLFFSGPVLIWNYQHHWISFAFQLNHGLESEKRSLLWPLDYLGSQIGILFPIALWFAVCKKSPRGTSFLQVFGWLPLAFFFYTSFRARVEANWPEMAHPEILALAFLNATETTRNWKWLRAQTIVWAAAALLIFSEVAHPWFPIDPKKLKTNEFTRFDVFLPAAKEHQDLYLGSYQMAASVSYKLRRQIYKLDGMNRRDFYDFTPQSHPTGDSFLVGAEKDQPLPEWVEKAGYKIVADNAVSDDFRLIEVSRRAKDVNR